MKIDTSTITQKTVWVHLDPEELHALVASAAWKAAGTRTIPQDASTTVHFHDDAPRSAPSRRSMRASVELVVTKEQPAQSRRVPEAGEGGAS